MPSTTMTSCPRSARPRSLRITDHSGGGHLGHRGRPEMKSSVTGAVRARPDEVRDEDRRAPLSTPTRWAGRVAVVGGDLGAAARPRRWIAVAIHEDLARPAPGPASGEPGWPGGTPATAGSRSAHEPGPLPARRSTVRWSGWRAACSRARPGARRAALLPVDQDDQVLHDQSRLQRGSIASSLLRPVRDDVVDEHHALAGLEAAPRCAAGAVAPFSRAAGR